MKTFSLVAILLLTTFQALPAQENKAEEVLAQYCFDCHDEDLKKGGLDMLELLEKKHFDGTLLFENLLAGKMPPAEKKQPTTKEKQVVLNWLAHHQKQEVLKSFRRISRHEFVHAVNDLLGINWDLAHLIPEDRGTKYFDSDRNIALSREMLTAFFSTAEHLLEFAFPREGFVQERIWTTSKVKDSNKSYSIYHRPYEEGILFSWTRANNGNSYSFFYDHFDPPVSGWYDLTFEAMKVGAFPEDISLQVYAGKYYYADDRPQPQRMLDVISLGNKELKSHRIRVFLNPGENISVHCYSKHNFRQKHVQEGAYIRQLEARGPIYDTWPPPSFAQTFEGLSLHVPERNIVHPPDHLTNLQKIGGKLSVSSFQKGMEKEKMQDGSNQTFWHTRFKPTLAKPPHYIILENPNRETIKGLSYATWSGGNGNGQVKAYAISFSDDGNAWDEPVLEGELDIRLANEQPIDFPKSTTKRFIKLLVTDAFTLDGRSLASIGKLDVVIDPIPMSKELMITVSSGSPEALQNVIRRFAEKAFSTSITDNELTPYLQVSLNHLKKHHDFMEAVRVSLKAIICSPRFLMAPGHHANPSYTAAAHLARTLWLSIPDEQLMELSKTDSLKGETLRSEIRRMLDHDKSRRMVRSFSDQWLNLRSWDKVAPSLKLYPQYNDLLDFYLPIETRTYLHHLIRENRPVVQLIDSDYSFLNQRLAQHYGIKGITGQTMRKVSFKPEMPRGGLLTMGSILKVTTDGYDTSPILRGAWISRNIVGTPLSPPPPNIPVIEPDHGVEAATLREQIEQHKSKKACYACHKSIDPYGFALENFDATGQWRTRYSVKLPHKGTFQYRPQGYHKPGGAIDAAGEINNHTFENIFGLKKLLLSNHRKIAYNFSRKFFEYVNGYQPSLKQRLRLLEMIPNDPKACKMKDVITDILVYSVTGDNV